MQQHIKVFFPPTFSFFPVMLFFQDVVGWGSSQRITLSVWPSCQLSPETWGARLSAQPSAATTRTLCNFNLSGGRGGRNVKVWQLWWHQTFFHAFSLNSSVWSCSCFLPFLSLLVILLLVTPPAQRSQLCKRWLQPRQRTKLKVSQFVWKKNNRCFHTRVLFPV